MPSLLSEVESQLTTKPAKVKSPPSRSKSPPEKPKGKKSPPGFSLSVTNAAGDVSLPAALKSPPALTFHAAPEAVKSPPGGTTLQIPGEGPTKGVTLQVPVGDGAPSGGGTAAPKRKGRVRGMSSVKRFEQEYVASDFLKDLTDKTTKKGKTKAPMPSVVELFSQVSSLKEEVLVAKKNEANMKLRVEDMEQEIKSKNWLLLDLERKAIAGCIRGEAHMRESIEKLHADMLLQMAMFMHDVEPDDSMMQTVDMSEVLKIEELNRLLFEETKRNEQLEEKIKEMEEEAANIDSPQLSPRMSPLSRGESFALRFDQTEKLQGLQEEIIKRDSEIGKLVAEEMLRKGEISRLEMELLQKDSEIRRLTDEKATLSVGSDAVEAEKKKLAAAHKRLADAEMRIVEKESELAAHASVSRSQEREKHNYSNGIPVLAFAGKSLSPRSSPPGSPTGSLSPRYRKISRA